MIIGIPILNRGDLLIRCIESIDFPVSKIVIVRNGNDKNVERAIGMLVFNHQNIEVHREPSNLGVSGSWNKIITSNPSDYWMLVGNDIQFSKGDLGQMHDAIMSNKDKDVFFANHGHSFWAVTKRCVEKVGLFDENFYPAYLEDCDHFTRAKLAGVGCFNVQGIKAIHGEAPHWGSSTILSNQHYKSVNNETHHRNRLYYRRKWGGDNGEEKFTNPFNDPEWPVSKWVLEPELRKQNSIW